MSSFKVQEKKRTSTKVKRGSVDFLQSSRRSAVSFFLFYFTTKPSTDVHFKGELKIDICHRLIGVNFLKSYVNVLNLIYLIKDGQHCCVQTLRSNIPCTPRQASSVSWGRRCWAVRYSVGCWYSYCQLGRLWFFWAASSAACC